MTLLIPLLELTIGVPTVLATITHLTHRHHQRVADDEREMRAIDEWLPTIRGTR